MKFEIRKVLTILLLLLSSLLLALVFYLNIPEHWQMENKFAAIAAELMLYYLLIIFVRIIFLLSLSFVELLFKKRMKPIVGFPLVTIIMPAFNEGKVIKKAIQSVMEVEYPNLEILVVDDGSSDDTFEVAKEMELHDNVRVIYQKNGGKSNALNNGIEQSNGDYYVCIDADSVLSKNLLMDSIPYFEADDNLAAVAGAVEVGNGNNLLTLFQKLEYIIGLNFHKMAQSCLNMVTIVPGPIGIFRKEFVVKIGKYHTDTFAEDCDLSMRLLMAGYNIKYCNTITARTEAPDEFRDLITQRYRWSRGMIQSIIKAVKTLRTNFTSRGFFVVAYMFFETLIIPIINFTFVIITLEYALLYDTIQLMGPYFIGLTVMDLTLCLYAIVMEKEVTILFFLGIFNRVTYGLALEVIRFFSIFDELFSLPMKWGVLTRKGMDDSGN